MYNSLKELRWSFYQMIFDEGDKVAWGKDDADASKRPAIDPIPSFFITDGQKFCINPLEGRRNGDNVTRVNALLFEIDFNDAGQLVNKEEQVNMFKKSGLPYASLVFSGKKSVHAILRFTEPIEKEWQKSWWSACYNALLKAGLKVDDRTKAIPQLSRLPGSTRQIPIKDNKGNVIDTIEVKQELLELGRRVTQQEVKDWLKGYEIEVESPYVAPPNNYRAGTNDHFSDQNKFKLALKWHSKSMSDYVSYAKSGNHDWLWKFGIMCYKLDLNLDATLHLSSCEFPSTYNTSAAGAQPIHKPIKAGWVWAKNQNIQQIQLT
jgi:hypothetical protein